MENAPHPKTGPAQADMKLGDRIYQWLDERTGIHSILRELLDEPIPGGSKYAYVFGSAILFVFISQVITGVCMAMYYVPSVDHAHTSVAYILKVVTGGSFVRSVHVYGADALIILLVMHMSQVFFYGAYKKRRELLWMSGGVLLLLMLSMAFTGYLLPWDDRAYFATTVGTNVMGIVPFFGTQFKEALLGGYNIGTLTLNRFFVLHVFILPAALFGFIATHIYLFRKAGPAGPFSGDPKKIRQKTEPFYPWQVIKDLVFIGIVIAAIGLLAYFHPYDLGPVANPSNSSYLPRPEWYFRPMFEWLKLFKGSTEMIGVLVIPTIGILIFFLWPFLDRSPQRAPWKRPLGVTLMIVGLAFVITLGWVSYVQDSSNPTVAKQLAFQAKQAEEYTAAPFKVQVLGIPAAAAASTNPEIALGEKVFTTEGCIACHGQGGVGTAIAPKLVGIVTKLGGPDKFIYLVQHRNAAMVKGGMPDFSSLTKKQMSNLAAYVGSLH